MHQTKSLLSAQDVHISLGAREKLQHYTSSAQDVDINLEGMRELKVGWMSITVRPWHTVDVKSIRELSTENEFQSQQLTVLAVQFGGKERKKKLKQIFSNQIHMNPLGITANEGQVSTLLYQWALQVRNWKMRPHLHLVYLALLLLLLHTRGAGYTNYCRSLSQCDWPHLAFCLCSYEPAKQHPLLSHVCEAS